MGSVLIAAFLVGAVCGVLATLLVVAERYLADYGTCVLDINEGQRRLEVEGGKSLLASLMDQGIFIPSACGGRGTCAYCKVHVVEGGGELVPTELTLLTEQEQEADVRISCQLKVRNDLAIAIPEHLLEVREYEGQVERIRDLTHDIKELRIRLVEPQTIDFVPGQYIQLECPPYGDNPEPVYRAYSIASPPSNQGHIELIIRLTPGGICTTWVFTLLEEGQRVRFNGPYGEFRLSDNTELEMVWIAGGSGMAPFWSIVRHMHERGIQRPCRYFFGAVQRRDLFFIEELRELEAKMPHFAFIPALSGEPEEDGWEGERGLITEVVDRHLDDGSDKEGYLCGSSGVIDAAIQVLRRKGMPQERIYFDKFT